MIRSSAGRASLRKRRRKPPARAGGTFRPRCAFLFRRPPWCSGRRTASAGARTGEAGRNVGRNLHRLPSFHHDEHASPWNAMNAVTQDLSNLALLAGSPEPLGATWTGEGVNFAVYSSGATNVELCLFDERGERELTRVALPQRTANVWHGCLPAPAAPPGLVYGLRVHGPYDPTHGLRYNPNKLLIDPYARSLAGAFQWSDALLDERGDAPAGPDPADSAPYNYKARVIDGAFDWGEDQLPATPWRDTVIYEAHVKGLTKLHPAVPERARGTYLGLANP